MRVHIYDGGSSPSRADAASVVADARYDLAKHRHVGLRVVAVTRSAPTELLISAMVIADSPFTRMIVSAEALSRGYCFRFFRSWVVQGAPAGVFHHQLSEVPSEVGVWFLEFAGALIDHAPHVLVSPFEYLGWDWEAQCPRTMPGEGSLIEVTNQLYESRRVQRQREKALGERDQAEERARTQSE